MKVLDLLIEAFETLPSCAKAFIGDEEAIWIGVVYMATGYQSVSATPKLRVLLGKSRDEEE